MVQELTVKNFLSFKGKTVFSFLADNNDDFGQKTQTVEVCNGVRLSRLAVIYGYNASGKSNMLSAFEFLNRFWFNTPKNVDEQIDVVPFLLDSNCLNQPSIFELVFWIEGVKFKYYLEVNETEVLKEELYVYTSIKPSNIFKRYYKDDKSFIDFNVRVNDYTKGEIRAKCLKNMSVFAVLKQVNDIIEEIEIVKKWMDAKFMRMITPKTRLFEYAERMLSEKGSDALKQYLISFARKADFNISGIDVRSQKLDADITKELLGFLKDKGDGAELGIGNNTIIRVDKLSSMATITKTVFNHEVSNGTEISEFELDKNLESLGTHRLLGLETALYEAINRGAFLSIDEIDSSLHPMLVEFIVYCFLNSESHSQLLLTTHYDGLLDLTDDLLRKDSVWFAEKELDGGSVMFNLTEIRGINRLSSIRTAYRNRRIGAIGKIQL